MMNGEIWWADLGVPFGSEHGFRLPVLILQSDVFNKSKISTCVVAVISTNMLLADAPGNVFLPKKTSKLPKDSVVNISQLMTVDKNQLVEKVSKIPNNMLKEIHDGLLLLFGV